MGLQDLSEYAEGLGVLFEDAFSAPPDGAAAANYNASLDAFEFVADSQQLMLDFFPGSPIPLVLVIDTATMEIVYKEADYDPAAITAAIEAIIF